MIHFYGRLREPEVGGRGVDQEEDEGEKASSTNGLYPYI